MLKDITTYFTRFVAYSQKAYHESFVTRNGIPWWNIDFARSYVIQKYLENNQQQHSFYPHLGIMIIVMLIFNIHFVNVKQKSSQKSNQSTKKQSKNDAETEFQEMIIIHQQILEEAYTLKSPEYHPQSPSVK
ncbi:hypothetical protein F8M41_011505 [Gigaspora margarita]|uniref:Uncharacterized protein n=1 Tax=Gigaspora margarita TaxID=4874 RepID=A0A8H3WZ25_GIGMA|nr:hypothetical protein F8M41_011505 [Gigaspora margarita]